MKRLLLCLVFLSSMAGAEIIFYKFDDPVKEERFNNLIEELRCPKCQNNNLADSNSPLSVDLKEIIYEKIHAGASDEEIVVFLKERYGDFIHYKPPVNSSTYIIWFGPFALLFAAILLSIRFFKTRAKAAELAKQAADESNLARVKAWQSEIGDKES